MADAAAVESQQVTAADLLAAGKWQDACDAYAKADEAGPLAAADYLGWGEALYALGKYQDAIAQYRKAGDLDPNLAVAFNHWGDSLFALKQYTQAAEQFRHATEVNPDSAEAFNKWGNTLYTLRKYTEAIEPYKKAIELDPQAAGVYNMLGNALHALGRYEDAIAQYRKAGDLDPKLAVAFNNWGGSLFALERYAEAAEQFRHATEVNPNFADAFNKWGSALYALGKYQEAIEHHKKAIELDPKVAGPYNTYGNALHALGHYEEAIEQYKKACEIDPSLPVPHTNWGNSLFALKRYDEAVEQYKKATAIDPHHAPAFASWANTLYALKKFEEAARISEQAIKLDPKNAPSYTTWGNSLYRLDRFDEAIEKYKKSTESTEDPSTRAIAYNNLGYAHAGLRRFRDASYYYKKATDLVPDYISAWLNWAASLHNERQFPEAIAKCEHVRKIDVNKSYVGWNSFLWGNALTGMGCHEEGIQKYYEAIQASPDLAYAYQNIADTHFKEGDYRNAESEFAKARLAYQRAKPKAQQDGDPEFFESYGSLLQEALREFNEAEGIYQEGLALKPDHAGILTRLATLHLAKRDEKPEQTTQEFWRAWQFFKKAEQILTARQNTGDTTVRTRLGYLYLTMGVYDKAETYLRTALQDSSESTDVLNHLGTLYSRKEQFELSARYFDQASRSSPNNLTLRSNLAESYLRCGKLESARAEYNACLGITKDHVESLIGLGEIYIQLGEGGDDEMFQQAIDKFNLALKKSESKIASKQLSKKEEAAIHYSLGYTKVKMFEAKVTDRQDLLRSALESFETCTKLDSEHYKAALAVERLKKNMKPPLETLWEVWGSRAVVAACAIVFVLAQLSFYSGLPAARAPGAGTYATISFASIALMAAGFYLPKLLKLKVAGIELEKSAVDQIGTTATLKITRPVFQPQSPANQSHE